MERAERRRKQSRAADRAACKPAENGLTLIEIAIVLAILGVLVAIVAVAVRGAGTTARGASKATDILEVQKAVTAYHGLHPQEKWPTLAKQSGSLTIPAGDLPTAPFSATVPETFVAIDWEATFTTRLEGTKTLVPAFLRKQPRHAYDVIVDADGDRVPDQLVPTRVWVLEQGGIVRVLLRDSDY